MIETVSRVWTWTAAVAALLWAAGTAEAQREYRVRIDSDPEGATVYLGASEDGNELGETPFSGTLPAGEHVLTFELDGYANAIREIRVRKRRRLQKFDADLEKLVTGIVSVTAPSGDVAIGADVLIDGEEVGSVPDEFAVAVGPHVVEVLQTGFDPFEEWVEVEEGATITISPELGGGPDTPILDNGPDEDPKPKVKRKVTPRDVGQIGSALVVVDTAVDIGGRHYDYSGERSDNLRPYDADIVPLFHLGAEVYPLAGHANKALRGVGLVGSFDRAVALTSTTTDGMEVGTTWQQVEAGLRGRTAAGDKGLVGATVSYATVEVSFDTADLADETPEVKYEYVRLAVDGRYDDAGLGFFGGASFLLVSSAGTAADRFRDASTFGLGMHGGIAYGIVPKVEARVVARYRMFSSTFTSEPSDTHFAAGATDHIYGIMLGAAFVY